MRKLGALDVSNWDQMDSSKFLTTSPSALSHLVALPSSFPAFSFGDDGILQSDPMVTYVAQHLATITLAQVLAPWPCSRFMTVTEALVQKLRLIIHGASAGWKVKFQYALNSRMEGVGLGEFESFGNWGTSKKKECQSNITGLQPRN